MQTLTVEITNDNALKGPARPSGKAFY